MSDEPRPVLPPRGPSYEDAPPPEYRPAGGTDGFAVAALVFGLIGGVLGRPSSSSGAAAIISETTTSGFPTATRSPRPA
ncbi:hypothetical protein SAMN05421504_107155 [Amycolatopsis xylanica]|uniref:Uncharacterized protein n=1 Tax=Amycolatopsis xylanica TaxID=589385 RepID=A0A1H3N6K0_9PSEU|nr:hypothetical protein [Amycolatopsis xylanica]SDY84486.1 hypothetical protein SAMN05421504_107155 [Amycolatopsis xylanica]